MNTNDPSFRAAEGCGNLTGEALERHLFVCAACRGQNRLAPAWDALRGDRREKLEPADDRFVARVVLAVRRDARRRRLQRWLLAAAAVLLFFFAAGANSRGPSAPPPSTEEAAASLATPSSALEGLLPE